jgi:hypothetical protein
MASRKSVKLKSLKQSVAKAGGNAPMHLHGENCTACGPTLYGCHIAGLFRDKKMWLMVIAAIVVVNVFQVLWNSQVMMADYVATANLWRPFDQMDFNLIYGANTLVGFFYAILFKLMYRGSGVVEGLKDGMVMAAPLAVYSGMITHATQPLPAHLSQMWAAGHLLQGALVGLVLSFVARCGCKK